MAAPWNPPIKNQDFELHIAVEDYANPGNFRDTPTIASGDFQVSKDGGAFANLGTLPAVEPTGTEIILLVLSATEMNADSVVIRGIDQTSPKEWADIVISIPTTSA